MDTQTTDAQRTEPLPPKRPHKYRKVEILLAGAVVIVVVVLSAMFVGELRWRWRRFMVDWS